MQQVPMMQVYSVPAQPTNVHSNGSTPVLSWSLPPDCQNGGYYYNGQSESQQMWPQQATPYQPMACIVPVMALGDGNGNGVQAYSPTSAGVQQPYDGQGNWQNYGPALNGQFQYPTGNSPQNGTYAVPQSANPPVMAGALPASPMPRNGAFADPPTAWIVNRLIEREKARMEKRWEEADGIRADLRRRGIEVEDRERIWKAKDGRRGQRPNHNDSQEVE